MRIDISGLSQLEIEEQFDDRKAFEAVDEEVREFADTISSYLPQLNDNLLKLEIEASEDEVKETMVILLSVVGNENATSNSIKGQKYRDIPLESFLITLTKNKHMKKMYGKYTNEVAFMILCQFDGIFFDVHKMTKQVEDGQYRTFTYVRSDITFSKKTDLLATYSRFRLPLIEKPIRWTPKSNGGYHLHQRKITTNKGYHTQPQIVCDVLNELQEQAWTHRGNDDLELNYNYNSFIKKGNTEAHAYNKSMAIGLTTNQTYDTMDEHTMYFEYRFDFRGRMYPTGYDINPQGNSIKKAGLRPKLF